MREVSKPFQQVMADLPASSAVRKPSSVSLSGVLIAMPVTAMRRGVLVSVVGKVRLHRRERAYVGPATDLADQRSGVGVVLQHLGEHCQPVAWVYLRNKHGIVQLERARVEPR